MSNITTVPSVNLKEMQLKIKDQDKLIKCIGDSLVCLAYYSQPYESDHYELCGFDARQGTPDFEKADHALCAYKEWKEKK